MTNEQCQIALLVVLTSHFQKKSMRYVEVISYDSIRVEFSKI